MFTKLLLPLLLIPSIAMAQVDPSSSCSAQISKKKEKTNTALNNVSGGGFVGSMVIGIGAWSMGAGPAAPIVALGATATASSVLFVSYIKKQNALKLFDGAANGGNDFTARIWRKAKKKDPAAYENITYAQFLASIHKADLSGEACKEKAVPNKKEVLRVVKINLESEVESESELADSADLAIKDTLSRSNNKDSLASPVQKKSESSSAVGQ